MTRAHLSAADRSAMARAVFALRSRVIGAERGPTGTSLEIVNNGAACLTIERELNAELLFEGLLRHRVLYHGLQCDNPTAAARAAGKAWRGSEQIGCAA